MERDTTILDAGTGDSPNPWSDDDDDDDNNNNKLRLEAWVVGLTTGSRGEVPGKKENRWQD
jgi:hypothetical protein